MKTMILTNPEEKIFQEMDENLAKLMQQIQTYVDGKDKLKSVHKSQLDEYEQKMFAFLWRARGIVSTSVLAKSVGVSRPTLYAKWSKFGFDINEVDESSES